MKYTFPMLSNGRAYLVMGPHVWGRNADLAEAVKTAKSEGRLDRYIVFNVPDDARVDEMGMIRWKDGTQTIHEVVRVGNFEEKKPKPTTAQLNALREYAGYYGRNWKSHLRDDWFNGRAEGELQVLRNTLGPKWLATFSLNPQ
jgi:hypothetical protein